MSSSGSSTHELGREAEARAADYLADQGYLILERNYRFERKELDLVCVDRSAEPGPTVVFVEVKSRGGDGFGDPAESLTPEKQRRLIRVARAYLHERRMSSAPVRFDVVGVRRDAAPDDTDPPPIRHWEDAFRAG